MKYSASNFLDLLELVSKQEETIQHQNSMISKLINENLEKENMIHVLSSEFGLDEPQ